MRIYNYLIIKDELNKLILYKSSLEKDTKMVGTSPRRETQVSYPFKLFTISMYYLYSQLINYVKTKTKSPEKEEEVSGKINYPSKNQNCL